MSLKKLLKQATSTQADRDKDYRIRKTTGTGNEVNEVIYRVGSKLYKKEVEIQSVPAATESWITFDNLPRGGVVSQ